MRMKRRNELSHWRIIFILAIFSVYFYVFMEWLFFITKPSFFSTLSFYEDLLVLFITPFAPLMMALSALFVLWAISRMAKVFKIPEKIFIALGRVFPAFILASCMLILVDNFTYTLFHFGIKSFDGLWRLGYGALFLVFCAYIYLTLFKVEIVRFIQIKYRIISFGVMALLILSVGGAVMAHFSSEAVRKLNFHISADTQNLPNILIFATDGLNADHMSVYGYERETTPFISKFATNALVFENAFSNADNSGGSIASMLTGKLPTQTRVIYPPDILRGIDAYQHFPGILRKLGYHSLDIGIRYYADAFDLNMRNSFDYSLFRKAIDLNANRISAYLGITFNSEIYFFQQLYMRIENRLLHIFAIRNFIDPYGEVTQIRKVYLFPDPLKIEGLHLFIKKSNPFFVHLHLLGTHGPMFTPNQRVFSNGLKQESPWMTEFYDDAILDFDGYFKNTIQFLESIDKLKNTIIVITSDHGFKHSPIVRIPLIIYFPNKSYVGRISSNAQVLDIAPTILDYLGIDIPNWMAGRSLISSDLDNLFPIFSVSVVEHKAKGDVWEKKSNSAPFFGMDVISVVICNKSFQLDTRSKILSVSEIIGHTSPCDESVIPDKKTVRREIVNHLLKNKYDVTSLNR